MAPLASDQEQLEAILTLQVYHLNFCAGLFCGFASIGIPFGSARDHVRASARLAFATDD